MNPLKAGETRIDYETDVTGARGTNDAYDLYLARNRTGNYVLVVFMKIQFFFVDGASAKWTPTGKTQFVTQWKLAIQQRWGNRILKNLSHGKAVRIDFRFHTQIGGWMLDHWEITVTKIPKGSFRRSTVDRSWGNVALDSEDLTLCHKGQGQQQKGAVHEFGHMLGLADEYKATSPHATDYRSVMNRGQAVLTRHDSVHMKWLEKKLKEHNIR